MTQHAMETLFAKYVRLKQRRERIVKAGVESTEYVDSAIQQVVKEAVYYQRHYMEGL